VIGIHSLDTVPDKNYFRYPNLPAYSLKNMVIEKLGRYVIVEEIGQGAMGVVYKAVDPLIDRTVAIKTINLDLSKEELENFEKRFQREVQSAGKLNHPNIVTVYDVGRTEGVAYMAMEFLEGKELREILDSGVVLPIEKIAHIASQVAEGLGFAHERGIVHRDVKPANVMVMKNGLVKITDFGIAQMSSASRTMSGMVMGSPKYMSPEQVVGQAVDGRSDIFSLAVVLYEMLTGKAPFSGDNISAIMYQILNDEPIPPKAFNQGIPDSINYIVLKALAKHPDKRYQNAKDMARDLKRYKTMEVPASGESAPVPGRMERRAKPRDSAGDATQLMPSMLFHEGELPPIQSTTSGDGWWNTQRFLLYAAIPAMIVTFAAVVTLSHTRNQAATGTEQTEAAGADTKTASTVAPPKAQPATAVPPKAGTQSSAASLAAGNGQPNAAAQPAMPSTADKAAESKLKAKEAAAKEKAKLKHEKAKLASAGTSKTDEKPKSGSAQPATVMLAISPWGEVFVDGARQGVSPPLRELSLSPGKHTVLVVNETFKPYSQTIEAVPGGSIKIKYKFQN
jgi:serine/threonine protein kinase